MYSVIFLAAENIHVLTVVLRSGDQPSLGRPQLQRVMRAHYAHREYVKFTEGLADSDDDSGPKNDDAWLYEDLILLAKLYSRLKDREQLIALIFEVSQQHTPFGFCAVCTLTLNLESVLIHLGYDIGSPERYHHDLLRTVGTSVSCGEHCGLLRGHAELHHRFDTDSGTDRRGSVDSSF